ncbi:hypothetical protein HDU98_001182 [Podochytrium sp. JEL0797]|nr:hypothetical protein HDU98_001182 [Podochytrium sp. JEL0797]
MAGVLTLPEIATVPDFLPVESSDQTSSRRKFDVSDELEDRAGDIEALEEEKDHASSDFPEGGLEAWLVVFGSFIASFMCTGMFNSFGIYNSYYLNNLEGSAFQIAFIGSVQSYSVEAFGVFAGMMSERLGPRRTIFIGTVILSAGLFLASFTTSVPVLILTQGLMYGCGSSFIYFSSISLPAQYFEKKRGLVTGIAVAGTGCGGLVFSIITEQMLSQIGLAWTLRVSAFICFISLALITPLMKARLPSVSSGGANPTKNRAFLKNPVFYFLCFACFFANWVSVIPPSYITVYADQRVNASLHDQSTLLAVFNACNILGRVAMGISSDYFMGPVNTLAMSMWITVASVFWWLKVETFPSLLAFGAVNGFFDGAFWGLFPVVIASVFGADASLGTMIGIIYSVCVGAVGSAPIAGWLEQTYGFWTMIMYAGVVSLLAAGCITVARVLVSKTVFKMM